MFVSPASNAFRARLSRTLQVGSRVRNYLSTVSRYEKGSYQYYPAPLTFHQEITRKSGALSVIRDYGTYALCRCRCGAELNLPMFVVALRKALRMGCGSLLCPATNLDMVLWLDPLISVMVQARILIATRPIDIVSHWGGSVDTLGTVELPLAQGADNWLRDCFLTIPFHNRSRWMHRINDNLPWMAGNVRFRGYPCPEVENFARGLGFPTGCHRLNRLGRSTLPGVYDVPVGSVADTPGVTLKSLAVINNIVEIFNMASDPDLLADTTRIRTISAGSLLMDIVDGAGIFCTGQANRSRVWDEITSKYRALTPMDAIILPLDANYSLFNVRTQMARRGLVAGEDYTIHRLKQTDEGEPLPRSQWEIVVKKLTDTPVQW